MLPVSNFAPTRQQAMKANSQREGANLTEEAYYLIRKIQFEEISKVMQKLEVLYPYETELAYDFKNRRLKDFELRSTQIREIINQIRQHAKSPNTLISLKKQDAYYRMSISPNGDPVDEVTSFNLVDLSEHTENKADRSFALIHYLTTILTDSLKPTT